MKLPRLFPIIFSLTVFTHVLFSADVDQEFNAGPYIDNPVLYRHTETGSPIHKTIPENEFIEQYQTFDTGISAVPLTVPGDVHEITVDFKYGQELTGKINLRLKDNIPVNTDIPVTAYVLVNKFNKKNEFLLAAAGQFNPDGTLELAYPGKRTDRIKILLTNVPGQTDPLQSLDVQGVVLEDEIRIMLIGDSITYGKYDDIPERYLAKRVYDKLIANGHNIDFVGSGGEEPYEDFSFPGKKLDQYYPKDLLGGSDGDMDVTPRMDTYRPNLVAIHLGTNDLNIQTKTVAPYEQDGEIINTQSGEMAILIDYLLKWHNGEYGNDLDYIVVSLIIPMEDGTTQTTKNKTIEFNMEISRMVLDFQSGKLTGQPEPVYLCDHFSRFQENPNLWEENSADPMRWDGLHPTKGGVITMGNSYYDVISYLLSGEQKWFREITWDANVAGFADKYFNYKAVSIADVTADSVEDVYISRTATGAAQPREAFYASNQEIPYTESAVDFHIDDPDKSMGSVFADIDNDGDFDLFNGNTQEQDNRLYENLNNQDFQEISGQAGIVNTASNTTSVLAFDCENDGDVDLFALNSETVNDFYINNGSGVFTRDNGGRGLNDINEPGKYSMSASAADFDNDGDVDIFVAKRNTPSLLWVNDGTGHFTEQAEQAGIIITDYLNYEPNGVNWVDLDNDADLDLIVTSTSSKNIRDPQLLLFENNGDGTFQEKTDLVNIHMSGYAPMVGDFDNDGFHDILTTNESTNGEMFLNRGNWLFEKQDDTGAEIFAGDVRGSAVFDYDNDGDLDFIAARSDVFNVFKQNNLNNGNSYLKVRAFGPDGNLGGFGTKIWVYEDGKLGDDSYLLGFREILSGTGCNSQYSPVQHFGLGNVTQCDLLAWFTDGTLVAMRAFPVNRTITIKPEMPVNTGKEPVLIAEYGGNNQAKIVGQTLDEPIVVKVTDIEGSPVQGANVTFEIKSGDAQLFLPDVTNDAISIEAETGQLSGFMQWYYDASAAGNGFVSVPSFLGNGGVDNIQMEITESDQYIIWLRYANAKATDNVGLSVDNYTERKPVLEENTGWQWVRINGDGGTPFLYDLNKSIHTIELTIYSGHPQIDKLLLTTDINYVPVGAEEQDNEFPNLTDREGLARRYVQLNQNAGPIVVEAGLQHNGGPVQGSPVVFDLTALPGPPVIIKETSGNGQAGDMNVPLAEPFVVSIFDAFNNPVSGIDVLFKVITGGGTINPAGIIPTDSLGQAKTTLTPGGESSIQQVQAIVDGLPGSPVTFTAVIRGVASDMIFISGDDQSGRVLEFLSDPVKVKILEEDGSPAIGFPVWYSVKTDTGGVVDAATYASYLAGNPVTADSSKQILTNMEGIAEGYWLLGKNAGTQELIIDAGNINGSPKTIDATAAAGDPALIFDITGNHQTAQVTKPLPDSLVVRIIDAFGNPINGHAVIFDATNGGRFNGSTKITTQTDRNGNAKAGFTVGQTAGTDIYNIEVSAETNGTPLPGSPVIFKASATPGPAALAEKISGDAQKDTVNRVLPVPLKVRVTDQYSNAIPGFDVQFWVKKGGGTIENENIVTKTTGANGYASAVYKLGQVAGENEIHAVCAGLTPESVPFTATALHDVPDKMSEVSGNDQSGVRGMKLNLPFRVRITDRFENNIDNFVVHFDVKGDQGDFDGFKSTTSKTGTNGIAEVYLTLGQELGDSNNVVDASALYNGQELKGSPITFYASVKTGVPNKIIPITSTSGLLGAPNKVLPDTIFVKVCDSGNLAIPNFKVKFSVISGGGKFVSNNKDTTSFITDSRGIAFAQWRLGPDTIEQRIAVSAVYNQQPLVNSPVYFSAFAVVTTAQSLVLNGGNSQTGYVGEPLPDPFSVRVNDELGLPVENHPVTFSVIKGDGHFNTATDTLVHTGKEGLASLVFTLGRTIGNKAYEVRASSSNQGVPLNGSPVTFYANGQGGITDPDSSLVTVESPVPASGAAFSTITVMLKDRFGNPLRDRQVELTASGMTASVSPLSGATNVLGQFIARASATQPGELTIRVRDITHNIWLDDSPVITFFSTNAAKILRISKSTVLAYPASNLADPLAVRITDDKDQPIFSYPVSFTSGDNHVQFTESQPVYTDHDGLAQTNLTTGTETGEMQVNAGTPGLQGSPVNFTVLVMQPANLLIHKVSGDSQRTAVNQNLPEPLQVLVHDNDNRPAGNIGVLFYSDNTDIAQVDTSTVKTNAQGTALTTITLGPRSGSTFINAKIIGTSSITKFKVFALSDNAENITLISGDNQKVTVGDTISKPLIVKLSDSNGNGTMGVNVLFRIHKGDGKIIGVNPRMTDANGLAMTLFEAGTISGENIIIASSQAVPDDSVSFTVFGQPDAAKAMAIAGGNKQAGVIGHKLNNPLDVKVVDQYGNGVPDIPVTFTNQEGHGHISPGNVLSTDSTGHAYATWILGEVKPTQYTTAKNEQLLNSPLQFEASVQKNSAPVISFSTDDFTVNEKDTLSFNVVIADAENDTVDVQGINLPEGAVFNQNSNNEFFWIPSHEQAGSYVIKFMATDHVGAISEKYAELTVINVNRPPRIIHTLPLDRNLGELKKGQTVNFSVRAVDDDKDLINYLWLVNDQPKATTESFKFESQNFNLGQIEVKVLVFDMEDTVSTSWTGDIITAIELQYFAGEYKAFDGIELNWKTRSETGNMGFFILRSNAENGPFDQIGGLVPSNSKGEYLYTDSDVQAGKSYYYRLLDIQTNGGTTEHEVIYVEPPLPKQFALHQNYPNPFNPTTTIWFETPKPSRITLIIFDILGREVKTLIDDDLHPGYHSYKWNGVNNQDLPVAAGVYYMVLNTNEGRFVKKIALVK